MTEEKKQKNFKWMRILQGAVCLFLILYGMSLCLESVLDIPISRPVRLLTVTALTVVLQLVQLGLKWAVLEILVFVGGFTVFCVKYQEILLAGMKQLANRGLELVNAYNRTEYLLWYLDTQEDYSWIALLLVFVLLGFLEGLILMCTRNRRHHFLIIAILPALFVASGLMVGWAASFVGISFIFFGLVWEALDMREQGSLVLSMVVAAGIGIPMLLVGNGKQWKQVELLHTDWYHRQLNLEDQMLAWVDKVSNLSLFSFGERRQYALKNDRPKYGGKEVFKMTVDYPISRPLYIRGFVGGTYEDGTWNRISRQEFADWARQKGSDEETYAGLVCSFPYDFLSYKQGFWAIGKEKHVSLELTQEKKDCTLMPYFIKPSENQTVLADGIYPPGKETQFEWEGYLELSDYDRDLASGMFAGEYGDYAFEKKSRQFAEYQKYAQEKYTGLPEEGLEEFKSYAKQYKETHMSYWDLHDAISSKLMDVGSTSFTIDDLNQILTEEELQVMSISEMQYIIQEVQKMLWEDNVYSLDLEEVPQGEDSVEYFLFDQHKGYCTHFATAATLLFRMNDIPARFVSGYLVMPSDFKKNKDGTWTASVTDERAHAWTEVFCDNIGFCPVEATPPAYTEMLDDMEDGQDLLQAVRQMEEENQKQEDDQEQEESQQQEDEKKQEESQKQEEKEKQNKPSTTKSVDDGDFPIWWMIGGTASLISIFLIFWQRRRCVLRDRKMRLMAEDRTYAVREIGRETGKILRLMGRRRQSGMSDREYCIALMHEVTEIDWERTFFIFQKAEFSEGGVTEEEYQEIFSIYQKLEKKLVSTGGIKGWFLRYIKIYP